MANVESFEFKTEVQQILDLMIHSVYSNREIFLRELISNASDAIDKLRYEAMTNKELGVSIDNQEIWITPDSANRTLTISDNGIGMSREEVVNLIGTIAKSGSKEFLQLLKKREETLGAPELIGQFGVGFYSAFMVADTVTLVTRRAGEDGATKWESSGDGKYTLADAQRDVQGTTITLHLKPADDEEGLEDFTDEHVIRRIVKKFSDFVTYPIKMNVTRTEIEKDADGKPKEGGKEKTVTVADTLNSMKAIWTRSKDEIKQEEYDEFYKHISHDWTAPLDTIHFKAEGMFEFSALLYIPEHAPFDMFFREMKKGINLYVKRVFIMDDCDDLMPDYLRFVRGIVDSEDLSLNLSRELLQENRQIRMMRRRLVKKVLDSLKDMKNTDAEKFKTFWREFGRVLKEGLYQDQDNRKHILDIALFQSTHSDDDYTTLADYITRLKPEQDAIYFMTGDSRQSLEDSPHMEAVKAKGYEVLLLTDPVDEIWTQTPGEYDGKPFRSLNKGQYDVGSDEEKKQAEEARKKKAETYQTLLETIKTKLEDKVRDVRLSSRLTDSASCLVGEEFDMSPNLIRMMKQMGQPAPDIKRILELNPDHPIMEKLNAVVEADKDDNRIADFAEVLYGLALLAEGTPHENPGRLSKLLTEWVAKAL